MLPVTEALAEEYDGKADILYFETTEYQVTALRWSIRAAPAVIVFDAKGDVLYRNETGIGLEKYIRSILKKAGEE